MDLDKNNNNEGWLFLSFFVKNQRNLSFFSTFRWFLTNSYCS